MKELHGRLVSATYIGDKTKESLEYFLQAAQDTLDNFSNLQQQLVFFIMYLNNDPIKDLSMSYELF